MADNNKVRIWIQLADANQIALSVNPDEEESYRKAEELVNTLWRKWMNRFKDSSEDVLARVAFQFARLYLEAYGENRQVNDFLTDLNQQLDTLLSEDKCQQCANAGTMTLSVIDSDGVMDGAQ